MTKSGLNVGGAEPAKASPAAAPTRITVADKSGKKFTVPKEQLADALKQGYTQVK